MTTLKYDDLVDLLHDCVTSRDVNEVVSWIGENGVDEEDFKRLAMEVAGSCVMAMKMAVSAGKEPLPVLVAFFISGFELGAMFEKTKTGFSI